MVSPKPPTKAGPQRPLRWPLMPNSRRPPRSPNANHQLIARRQPTPPRPPIPLHRRPTANPRPLRRSTPRRPPLPTRHLARRWTNELMGNRAWQRHSASVVSAKDKAATTRHSAFANPKNAHARWIWCSTAAAMGRRLKAPEAVPDVATRAEASASSRFVTARRLAHRRVASPIGSLLPTLYPVSLAATADVYRWSHKVARINGHRMSRRDSAAMKRKATDRAKVGPRNAAITRFRGQTALLQAAQPDCQ